MIDEALGTVLIGGRLAWRTAGVALAPARAVWRSPIGAPGRAFLAKAGAAGAEGRLELADLLRAAAAELSSAIDDAVPALVLRTASSRRTALAIDALFASELPETAIDRLIQAGVVERVLERVLAAKLADRVADALLADGVAERVVNHLLAGGLVERIARDTLASELPEELLRQVLAGPLPGVAASESVDLVESAAGDPRTAAALEQLLANPAIEELLGTFLDSKVTLGLTDRLLASSEMQRILETVAASPEIRTAVAEQSAGIATDVAAGVRSRSVRLDDAAEQAVRGIFRRGK